MIVIHRVKQGSEDWHQLRKGRWTGSRAIKLLQGKPLPDDSSTYQSSAMRRGTVLEPIAIKEFERDAGTDVLTVGFVTNTIYPNAGYSPDGIVGDTLLEVKCLNGDRHENLIAGNIPLEYLAQIHLGMVICELEKARLLAFNPEYEQQLTILDIEYDTVIADNIKAKLKSASSV
jgi:predicted phage-related endonuclease